MIYSFYNKDTGIFITKTVRCPKNSIWANTPIDCIAVEGEFDPKTQRIDLQSGEVIDLDQ